jgi:hypothetical protein
MGQQQPRRAGPHDADLGALAWRRGASFDGPPAAGPAVRLERVWSCG